MAKKSQINRDNKRKALIANYGAPASIDNFREDPA